jgi:hypothetical protein
LKSTVGSIPHAAWIVAAADALTAAEASRFVASRRSSGFVNVSAGPPPPRWNVAAADERREGFVEVHDVGAKVCDGSRGPP